MTDFDILTILFNIKLPVYFYYLSFWGKYIFTVGNVNLKKRFGRFHIIFWKFCEINAFFKIKTKIQNEF